jgi:hypothetical protein
MRIYDRWSLKLLAVFVVTACAIIPGPSPPKQRIDPELESLGGEFVSGTAPAKGTTLHYVSGGAGPGVILLRGFPEDWYAYHRVMRYAEASKEFEKCSRQ